MNKYIVRLIPRYGTLAQWTSSSRILLEGELSIETDTGRIKFGDGQNVYSSLTYFDQLAPKNLMSYTKAGLPAAASYTGAVVYVTGEVGGDRPAYSNGTNWKWFSDDTNV
jgi:hypothetical protein